MFLYGDKVDLAEVHNKMHVKRVLKPSLLLTTHSDSPFSSVNRWGFIMEVHF